MSIFSRCPFVYRIQTAYDITMTRRAHAAAEVQLKRRLVSNFPINANEESMIFDTDDHATEWC